MSLRVRVALGRIVLVDVEFLGVEDEPDDGPIPTAHGVGTVVDPVFDEEQTHAYGFTGSRSDRLGS